MLRQDLSAQGLYNIVSKEFSKIKDLRRQNSQIVSYHDGLMSACGMFSFKNASLLAFEKNYRQNDLTGENLKTLFSLKKLPSDTTMREIIDQIPTAELYKPFKRIFSAIQRGKDMESFQFLDGKYLIALDGTGFFSSHKVHCPDCCVKKHRNGDVTYYHQSLSAVMIHPEKKVVIPLAPEPITLQDGKKKNDCERNAAKRFLERLRREHPHLKIIITEDGLSANAPHIELIKELEMDFILGCKPGDHKHLFDFVLESEKLGVANHHEIHKDGSVFKFRFMNGVPLNDSSQLLVNFLECTEEKKDGSTVKFSWVVSEIIKPNNCYQLMKGGRARWKIENETFNTLKNQGYNFEHNYGHGNKFLSNNLMVLMMLVFLIDQVQLLSCKVYQKAVEKAGRWATLWEKFRVFISHFKVDNWETLLRALAFGVTAQFKINDS